MLLLVKRIRLSAAAAVLASSIINLTPMISAADKGLFAAKSRPFSTNVFVLMFPLHSLKNLRHCRTGFVRHSHPLPTGCPSPHGSCVLHLLPNLPLK